VDHERSAANVAVRPEQLLPQVLDARRVLAVEQLVQRFDQRLRGARVDALEVTPADDTLVRFDANVDDGIDPEGTQSGDANGRAAVGDLHGGIALGSERVGNHGQRGLDWWLHDKGLMRWNEDRTGRVALWSEVDEARDQSFALAESSKSRTGPT